MASYKHFEIANSPTYAWEPILGTSYGANSSQVAIHNYDGTLTWLLGSFTVAGGVVTGGTFTSMLRTSGDGAVTYENITGFSADAVAFLSAASNDAKFALVLSGSDTMTGYSGDDVLNGHGSNDAMTGGLGNDQYFVDSVNDLVVENPNEGTDTIVTTLASYALGANLEGLGFIGSGPFLGIGNAAMDQHCGDFLA